MCKHEWRRFELIHEEGRVDTCAVCGVVLLDNAPTAQRQFLTVGNNQKLWSVPPYVHAQGSLRFKYV